MWMGRLEQISISINLPKSLGLSEIRVYNKSKTHLEVNLLN